MATVAMASRATRRCWLAWFWSTVGRCHDDLVDYIRARKEELGLSNEFIEEKCLMTKGHCGKLIGPSREKNLSKFPMDYFFSLLAFQLVPQPDPEQEARMHGKWERRSESQGPYYSCHWKPRAGRIQGKQRADSNNRQGAGIRFASVEAWPNDETALI
jgi:hypothetical protein